MKSLNKIFQEYYYISCLSEAQQSKYYLIQRYEEKVSARLKQEMEDLFNLGREKHSKIMAELIYIENPLFKNIKDNDFYSQPCIFKLE